jgi:hypothetical protein
MGYSLNNIQHGIKQMPRKIIIYGPPKIGKSTLAGSAAKSLMIPTEDRVAHIDCKKTNVVQSTKDIKDIFEMLLEEKHPYKRVIVDTLDWLEPLIHKAALDRLNEQRKGAEVKSITDDNCKETAFQKGLKYHAVEAWKRFLQNCDELRANGMDVILVAHCQIVTVNPPNGDSYDKWAMKIDKHSLSVLEEWADIIAFYDKKIFVKSETQINTKKGKALPNPIRVLYLGGDNPSMINGNSFGFQDNVEVPLASCSDIMEWILTGPYDDEEPKKIIKGEKK